MVMRLNKNVKLIMPTGEKQVSPISGIYGFIPVYETEDEAKQESQDGLFKIVEIEIPGDESLG